MLSIPNINIREEKYNYKIEMITPGFKKEDFNIYTEGHALIISYRNGIKNRSEGDLLNFSQKMKSVFCFFRFLALPDDVDSDHVTAKYNGTLELSIPKKVLTKKRAKPKYNN